MCIRDSWDGAWSFSSQWNSRKYILEIPFQTGGGLPDFTVSNVTGIPSSLGTGDQLNGSFDINNIGMGTSIFHPIAGGIFLSSDQVVNGGDQLLFEYNFSDLSSGAVIEQGYNFVIPNTPAGYYYLVFNPNYVGPPELNTINNDFAIPVTISTSPIPPVSYTHLTLPTTPYV